MMARRAISTGRPRMVTGFDGKRGSRISHSELVRLLGIGGHVEYSRIHDQIITY